MSGRPGSLTGALLARKGGAAPTRLDGVPADFVGPPAPVLQATASRPARPSDQDPADRAPAAPHSGDPRSGDRRSGDRRSGDRRRRFTLRLSEDQHRRMRLAALQLGRSSQQLVLDALDDYLMRQAAEIRGGDCRCLSIKSG